MSYQFYKVLHLLGVMILFFSLGGLLVATYTGADITAKAKKMVFSLHGLALLIILVAGFGLLARLGFMHDGGLPGWIYGKLTIWLLLAAGISLVKRKGQWGWPLVVLILTLGLTAAHLAVVKPPF